MTGETIIGTTTLPTTPLIQCTVLPDARPAPTSPPVRAWDEEDGSPKVPGDEAGVQGSHDVVSDLIAAVLDLLELSSQIGALVGFYVHQSLQHLARGQYVLAGDVEEVVVGGVL